MSNKDPLEQGRASYARREWDDAYRALAAADKLAPLSFEDLTRLAWSAGLTGRDEEMLAAHERRYQICMEANDDNEAARAAFWLGFRLFSMGERGRATAWLSRAERIVERQDGGNVVQGYLLLPQVHRHLANLDFETASEVAVRAIEIGERFREADLAALARNLQGRALLRRGDIDNGLALLDEAMLAVTARELSPIVTGVIYCSVIAGCQQIHALERSREWTSALASWCEAQPQLVQFTGTCQVHRAEILQFSGDWDLSAEEARRATAWYDGPAFTRAAGADGFYQLGEIHRLRGEFAKSEAAYQRASEAGREPQPGLALLRMAQGQPSIAANSIRRMMNSTPDALQRLGLLLPYVEIMLAAGALDEARSGCDELQQLAAQVSTSVVQANAAHAKGAVLLATGETQRSLEPLKRAFRMWQQLGSPYMEARARVLLARAFDELDDSDASQLELHAARATFERLGAAVDLANLNDKQPNNDHGLTARELEVLRLIATGKTNKAIARELSLSEKTIDRHVSNMFSKLDLPSRAAATAFAFQNKLVPSESQRASTSSASKRKRRH